MTVKPNQANQTRLNVCQQILKLLNIEGDNKTFYHNDVSDSVAKQIVALGKENAKYFNYGRWGQSVPHSTKPYVSILTAILKDMKITTTPVFVNNEAGKAIKSGLKLTFPKDYITVQPIITPIVASKTE